MSNMFFHAYRVQTVKNSFPGLGFEMGSIREYVDLCSNISRPDEGIKGKFYSCSICTCQHGVTRELQPERAETWCFTFLPNRFFLYFSEQQALAGSVALFRAGTTPFIWGQLQHCPALFKKPYIPNVPWRWHPAGSSHGTDSSVWQKSEGLMSSICTSHQLPKGCLWLQRLLVQMKECYWDSLMQLLCLILKQSFHHCRLPGWSIVLLRCSLLRLILQTFFNIFYI